LVATNLCCIPSGHRPSRDCGPDSAKDKSSHFPVSDDFRNASYLKLYDVLLCQRLVQEQLYSAAAVIASPREAISKGNYADLSDITSLKAFVSLLAGHVAAQASRLGKKARVGCGEARTASFL